MSTRSATWDNAIAWDGKVKGWPNRLQEEGLYNATIGKLHYRREEDPYGIDRQIEPMHIYNGIGMVWGLAARSAARHPRLLPDVEKYRPRRKRLQPL